MVTALTRLSHLGVPSAFHDGIAARRAPRFHVLLPLAVILATIAAAVVAIVAWSRHVSTAAEEAATTAHAILYDSDIGAESVGLLFIVLLATGWLFSKITRRRGSEKARNGWAADLVHEPAKYKAITNWLWKRMIRKHTASARSADEFLDRLGSGIARDLGIATLIMVALTALLGAVSPSRASFATGSNITDRAILPLTHDVVHPTATATSVVSGCADLPKEGNTLVYRLNFPDGAMANLGAWKPLAETRLTALEAIEAQLPKGILRERFANPIGSDPLTAGCLKAFGGSDQNGIARLLQILSATKAERTELAGQLPLSTTPASNPIPTKQ